MTLRGWWRRLTSGERRLEHRPDWPRFAGEDYADRIMTIAVTDQHHSKQHRSIGRWVLRSDGEECVVYLKRHYTAPWWRRILAMLKPGNGWSAAAVEWRRLHWAQSHGVPVPQPVALGEFIGPGLRLESFLAVEELTGMAPLHLAIPQAATRLPAESFQKWKRGVIAQVAELARLLHRHRRFHKDLYLCHFYVRPPDGDARTPAMGTVHMIDFHRLGRHPLTAWFWRVKDLAQLLFSSDVAGVTDHDRLRFFRQYLGSRKPGRLDRWLLWLVRAKANLYHRQNKHTDVRDSLTNHQVQETSA
jgi:Lipopolysaccharide kinase (Kdo/WaaP) family